MSKHWPGYDGGKYRDKDLLTAYWFIIDFDENERDFNDLIKHYEYYQEYILQYYTNLYGSPEISTYRQSYSSNEEVKYSWILEDGSQIAFSAEKPYESGGSYSLTLHWYYDPEDQLDRYG